MSVANEVADGCRDLCRVGLKGEMAGVEEAHDRIRHVTLERLGAGRQEEGIVLAPRSMRYAGTERSRPRTGVASRLIKTRTSQDVLTQ